MTRSRYVFTIGLTAALLAVPWFTQAQDEVEPELRIPFYEYDPPSTLEVAENPVTRARYPFIDVHNHQFRMADQDLEPVLAEMDKLNMGVLVESVSRFLDLSISAISQLLEI